MKVAHTLNAKSPAGGSILCEIATGGRQVRITHTKGGLESVVVLDAGTVGAMKQLLELAFLER